MYYNKVEICGVNTSKLPTLTSSEKKELLRRTKQGDTEAREELIDGNLRLVLSIIQRFTNRHENLDDLFQVGCIGLIKAVDNFNIDIDVEFSTYAVPMNIESREILHDKGSLHMTRKQALQTAVEILSKTMGNEKAAEVLKEMMDEMPLVHWSDQSIRDAVEQFILENGRVPTASDFRKKGMPSHTVIKQKYKTNLSQWLAGNYPAKKETFEERKARHTENFIEDYARIKPKSAKEFNRKKRPETVGWGSMVKYYGVTKWRELLKILNLTPYGDTRKKSDGKEISVRIHSDYNFKE